jgi:hypothetical protein
MCLIWLNLAPMHEVALGDTSGGRVALWKDN